MEIVVDFLEIAQQETVRASADRLFADIKECAPHGGEWNLQELIWPAIRNREVDPRLRLLPLERVGAEQGFGGSYVMIGYLQDKQDRIYPSQPLVVKVSKNETEARAKLAAEWNAAEAIRPYVAYQKESFAFPLRLDPGNDSSHAVLWSPFLATELSWDRAQSHGHELRVCDLWRVLRRNYIKSSGLPRCDLGEQLKLIYRAVRPLHDRGGRPETKVRNFGEEYDQYLRGFSTVMGWGQTARAMWRKNPVEELGGTFYNPINCVEKLRKLEGSLRLGAIHGDLHPRNVVIDQTNQPHLIDFGWAADRAHIAKDFVLMECNLRFVTARPDIAMDDLIAFTRWIDCDTEPPTVASEECATLIGLIQQLRTIARAHFPPDCDWDTEYIVPLFLTAFGLLQVLPSIDNQIAARLTILNLSQYLKEKRGW